MINMYLYVGVGFCTTSQSLAEKVKTKAKQNKGEFE